MINYIMALRKYAVFSGRATREEYWWFLLTHVLIVYSLANGVNIGLFGGTSTILLGYILITIIPFLAVLVRRLHDVNVAGWWVLVFCISNMISGKLMNFHIQEYVNQEISVPVYVLIIAFLVCLLNILIFTFTLQKGTKGTNRFGKPPIPHDKINAKEQELVDKKPDIFCPNCNRKNAWYKDRCTECNSPLTQQEKKSTKTPTQVTEGNSMLIECLNCKQMISKRAETCPKCGQATTTKTCNICKNNIPSNSRVCPECGEPSPFKAQGEVTPQPVSNSIKVKSSRSSGEIVKAVKGEASKKKSTPPIESKDVIRKKTNTRIRSTSSEWEGRPAREQELKRQEEAKRIRAEKETEEAKQLAKKQAKQEIRQSEKKMKLVIVAFGVLIFIIIIVAVFKG